MLLLLAEYLQQFHKGFAVFQYLTLRGILGVLTALALSLWLGPWMIRTLQMRQIGQSVRNDGPQSHLSKKGTPTMGGALILTAIAVSTLLWADLSNRYVWTVLAVTLLFPFVAIRAIGQDKQTGAAKLVAQFPVGTVTLLVVKTLAVGDNVCMEPGIPNHLSRESMRGMYNIDPSVKFWATPPIHGCLRHDVVHPANLTFKLPDNVSFGEAVLAEMMVCPAKSRGSSGCGCAAR